MLEAEIIKRYINILESIDSDLPLKYSAIEFIRSYKGNNKKDLDTLVLSIIEVLTKYSDLKIESDGYKKLKELNDDFEKETTLLISELRELEEGSLPISPPVDANLKEIEFDTN